jgi:dTDP-4-dehydrorhamnose reductase
MRVLILGGSGMLGHKLWQTFASRFESYVTFRGAFDAYQSTGLFDPACSFDGVTVEDFNSVSHALESVRPEVVINCIGVVKQDAAAKDSVASIEANALFPHRVAKACAGAGSRLIHLSTDCVFSGRRGNYTTKDFPDADDLYGRTKLLGEVDYEHCLTLRTSIIGRELKGSHGLLEWFLSQEGKAVSGFNRAFFSGFTTAALASIIGDLIEDKSGLHGVWHVASQPIDKFELLTLIKTAFKLQIEIQPDEKFVSDRSLNGDAFRKVTGYLTPSWPEMIEQLVSDPTPYQEIRRKLC